MGNLTTVVEILRVGLAGLVFLLALLGYRLLRQAVSTKVPPSVLKAINRYILVCVGLTILVGAFSAFDAFAKDREAPNVQGLQACRDSLSRLESQSHIPNVTVAALTQWIHEHVHQCKAPLEALDGE